MLSGQDKEVELLAPDRCDAQEVQSPGRSEHLGADHYLFLSATPVEGQHERSDQIVQGGSLNRLDHQPSPRPNPKVNREFAAS